MSTPYNIEDYPIGSVLYFINNYGNGAYMTQPMVEWGVVDGRYDNGISIRLYEIRPCEILRLFLPNNNYRDVYVDDMQFPSEYYRLPKNWSYDTRLFEIIGATPSDMNEFLSDTKIGDAQRIMEGIEKGYLVPRTDHGEIEVDVNSNKGMYRIVRNYRPYRFHELERITLNTNQLYKTWEEANDVLAAQMAEMQRKSLLSDKEFNIETIREKVAHWSALYDKDNVYAPKYLDYLLNLPKVENVDVRLSSMGLEWKYGDRKKWNQILLD